MTKTGRPPRLSWDEVHLGPCISSMPTTHALADTMRNLLSLSVKFYRAPPPSVSSIQSPDYLDKCTENKDLSVDPRGHLPGRSTNEALKALRAHYEPAHTPTNMLPMKIGPALAVITGRLSSCCEQCFMENCCDSIVYSIHSSQLPKSMGFILRMRCVPM